MKKPSKQLNMFNRHSNPLKDLKIPDGTYSYIFRNQNTQS